MIENESQLRMAALALGADVLAFVGDVSKRIRDDEDVVDVHSRADALCRRLAGLESRWSAALGGDGQFSNVQRWLRAFASYASVASVNIDVESANDILAEARRPEDPGLSVRFGGLLLRCTLRAYLARGDRERWIAALRTAFRDSTPGNMTDAVRWLSCVHCGVVKWGQECVPDDELRRAIVDAHRLITHPELSEPFSWLRQWPA